MKSFYLHLHQNALCIKDPYPQNSTIICSRSYVVSTMDFNHSYFLLLLAHIFQIGACYVKSRDSEKKTCFKQ